LSVSKCQDLGVCVERSGEGTALLLWGFNVLVPWQPVGNDVNSRRND